MYNSITSPTPASTYGSYMPDDSDEDYADPSSGFDPSSAYDTGGDDSLGDQGDASIPYGSSYTGLDASSLGDPYGDDAGHDSLSGDLYSQLGYDPTESSEQLGETPLPQSSSMDDAGDDDDTSGV